MVNVAAKRNFIARQNKSMWFCNITFVWTTYRNIGCRVVSFHYILFKIFQHIKWGCLIFSVQNVNLIVWVLVCYNKEQLNKLDRCQINTRGRLKVIIIPNMPEIYVWNNMFLFKLNKFYLIQIVNIYSVYRALLTIHLYSNRKPYYLNWLLGNWYVM